jgi:glutathione S-transferase
MQSQPHIADNWYPKDPKTRALVDEYLEQQHNAVRYPCAMYFQTKWLIPTFSGKKPNEKKVEYYEKLMKKSLDSLENVWLESADKNFLATSEISFADILAACELEQPRVAGYDVFNGRPKLTKWHERVKEQTNPLYDEALADLNDIISPKGKRPSKFDMLFVYRYLRYVKFKRFFE